MMEGVFADTWRRFSISSALCWWPAMEQTVVSGPGSSSSECSERKKNRRHELEPAPSQSWHPGFCFVLHGVYRRESTVSGVWEAGSSGCKRKRRMGTERKGEVAAKREKRKRQKRENTLQTLWSSKMYCLVAAKPLQYYFHCKATILLLHKYDWHLCVYRKYLIQFKPSQNPTDSGKLNYFKLLKIPKQHWTQIKQASASWAYFTVTYGYYSSVSRFIWHMKAKATSAQ